MTTILARRSQMHINVLGAHVTPYDPQTQVMIDRLRQTFMARGSDLVTATRQAYASCSAWWNDTLPYVGELGACCQRGLAEATFSAGVVLTPV